MAVPIEEARTFPKQVQELMGYALGTSALGFVDHQDPNDFLNRTSGSDSGDIYQGLGNADGLLKRFKISGSEAVGRPYFPSVLPKE